MTVAPPPRNPIIPGNTADRTGTAGILRRALADIRRRWTGLTKDVQAIIDRIPVYELNDIRTPQVRYGLTVEQLSSIAIDLQAALERWITDGKDLQHQFWWDAYVQDAVQLGTAQTAVNLAGLSTAYAAARSLESVIYSEPYRNRVGAAKFKSYEHWTGLGGAQRAELASLITQATADGLAPREIKRQIAERLAVSRSRAELYAQTDITDTLRQARMAEADEARDALNLNIGLLWTSALIPTTRPWHASRNGRVYTSAEVRDFYSQRGNRYRCHCATTECLLDAYGKPILTGKLKAKMKAERESWERAHGKD